jgi:hypothetical protein
MEASNSARKNDEGMQSVRKQKPSDLPVVVINTGFILMIQVMVFVVFCN